MTNTETLLLRAAAAQLELLQLLAKALGVFHSDEARLVQEQIEARLDSMTADEADGVK